MSDSPPPILLVHGFGAAAGMWQTTGWTRAIDAAGRTAIAPDLRGHGQAPRPHDPDDYAPARLVADLLAVLPDTPVDVVGYSLGAQLALDIAISHRHRVRRLVLGGIGSEPAVSSIDAEAVWSAVSHGEPIPAGAAASLWQMASAVPGCDARALAACLAGVARHRRTVGIPGDLPPALVFVGADDPIARNVRGLVDALPAAELLELPGRDHRSACSASLAKQRALDFLRE
ncbi:alpha/beta hydrolase [Acrocarpospora pleiomorpha]|uniref:Alpha/beta hydrolase n=1 Tax=Acrocarpospora pleiomorpha TaxID=90975 RepID=A0A5M3XZ07_9ACTN|nr:alpha/beta fold hydrolase [Acrocarpospora pleiomorpha]GES24693.1 alpha/beta hydrolase [Acrocarpospora pleiomorpha]